MHSFVSPWYLQAPKNQDDQALISVTGQKGETIDQFSAAMETAIFTFNSRADSTQDKLKLLNDDAETKFGRIQGELSQMMECERKLVRRENDCQR